jgi:hypothetical protein
MHAHNELTVLNRILMFSMNKTANGELHDSAQSVQMWCLLQVLAAKLVETWNMLNERFLKATPEDPSHWLWSEPAYFVHLNLLSYLKP